MNVKENPRNSTVTFRVTKEEKEKLEKLAKKETNGKVSQLVWQICLEYIAERENKNGVD